MLKVRSSEGADRRGIPFFAQKAIWRQTTEYQRGYVTAVLTVEVFSVGAGGQKGPREGLVDFTRYAWTEPQLALIRALELALASKKGAVDPVKDFLNGLSQIPPGEGQLTPQCVANYLERVTVVDYDTPYYIEPVAPLFGKSSFEPKFNSDGTLGTVKIESESHPELIADLLPIKEFLSATLLPTSIPLELDKDGEGRKALNNQGFSQVASGPAVIVEFTLAQRRDGVRIVASFDWAKQPGSSDPNDPSTVKLPRLRIGDENVVMKTLPLQPGPAKPDEEKKGGYQLSATLLTPTETKGK